MHSKNRRSRLPSLTLALCLAGCGASATSPDILESARPVPIVVSQAVTLTQQQQVNQQFTDKRLRAPTTPRFITTVAAEDFEGHPFVHLNFTTPFLVSEPLRYGLDNQPQPEGIYGTSITGASSARSVLSMTSSDVSLLQRLASTAQALGGAAQVKRVVAAVPTVILLEDQRGGYWDVRQGVRVDGDTLRVLQEEYAQARVQNNDAAIAQTLSAGWGDKLDAAPAALAGLTRPDGNLDVAAALQRLEAAEATTDSYSTDRKCRKVLFWTECTNHEYGAMPAEKQAHRAIQGDNIWTNPRCVAWTPVKNSPLGCGPAAFIGMVWRDWANGQRYYGKSFNGESYDAWSYNSSSIAGQMAKEVPGAMGSCVFGNGTMTLPGNFQSGGNQWLAQHGSPRRVKAIIAPFGWRGPEMATALRRQIGNEQGPAVAQFRTGAFEYHYSPVSEYRVTSAPLYYDVSVKGFDEGISTRGWYSLTDHWAVVTSLYYLQ